MTAPKYTKGERLTASAALAEIVAGRPVFERDKIQTAGWSGSWRINYVMSLAGQGQIFAAVPAALHHVKHKEGTP